MGRGEEVRFESNVGVFLSAGEGKHLPIPTSIRNDLTDGYEWMAPKGIEVVKGTVQASCGTVRWSDAGHDYSADGANIKVSVTVRIKQDCPEGSHWLAVALPVLSLASHETNTTPMAVTWLWTPVIVASRQLVQPAPTIKVAGGAIHAIPVQLFRVKASASGALFTKVLIGLLLLVLAVLVIWLAGKFA